MLFSNQREDHREILLNAWEKYKANEPLSALENQVVSILLNHPEYHKMFDNPEKYLYQDFFEELGETNPFLHLSLHLTLLEQINTNRPKGITPLFQKAIQAFGDIHEAEHCIMHAIALAIHDILLNKKEFDEKKYFKRIKKAIKNRYW